MRSTRSRLGLGLFAIHDDEDVAEVKGVPTFRYKLGAFALSSGIAGAVGSVYSINVSYVTVGETFEITVIMYPVVMSIFGGSRHWLGPALGAIIITVALYGFPAGPEAALGRGGVALGLILVVLLLPHGVMSSLTRSGAKRHRAASCPSRHCPSRSFQRRAPTRRLWPRATRRCSNATMCRRPSAACRR